MAQWQAGQQKLWAGFLTSKDEKAKLPLSRVAAAPMVCTLSVDLHAVCLQALCPPPPHFH